MQTSKSIPADEGVEIRDIVAWKNRCTQTGKGKTENSSQVAERHPCGVYVDTWSFADLEIPDALWGLEGTVWTMDNAQDMWLLTKMKCKGPKPIGRQD